MYVLFYNQGYKGGRGSSFWVDLNKTPQVAEPSRITKETISQVILDHTERVCRKTVSKSYVTLAIPNNTLIYVIADIPDIHGIKGFLLAHPLGDNTMYLDVICADPGYGKHLLNVFIDSVKSYDEIVLSALTSVLSYYPQFGFAHREDCVGDPQLIMPDPMIKGLKAEDPGWQELLPQFILHLRDKGFVVNTKPECQNPALSYADFMAHGCDSSGFEMRKCIRKHSRPALETRRRYRERQTKMTLKSKLKAKYKPKGQ
jgi:hypothetical protein